MKEKKSRQIYPKSALVRCTEDELKTLHERAENAGESLSRFLVKSGLSDDKIPNKDVKEEIRQLRLELRKIGINLNQIAYSINAGRYGSSEIPNESELEEIQKLIKPAISKLLKTV